MKKSFSKKPTLLGAAVIGIALYGLFATNKGKKARKDLQGFVKEVLAKRQVLGKISETAYDEAVDMAARLYKGSKKMTVREVEEMKNIIEDLKKEWQGETKKSKK